MHKLSAAFVLVLTILYSLLPSTTRAQASIKVTIIEPYGNYTIPAATIKKQLGIQEGDSVNYASKASLNQKLKSLPGVKNADVSFICCDPRTNGSILFAGISETDKYAFTYHKPPAKNTTLPHEITATNELLFAAMHKAVQAGNPGEDHSQGHALLNDSTARQQQLKFVAYAKQYMPQLKNVLYQSSSASQRALAADVIAYAADKKTVVKDLLYAVQDPDEHVRNNATRALGVIAEFSNEHPEAGIVIAPTLFINMLHSVIWTDRNKGSWTLFPLTQKRDPALLKKLQNECMTELTTMASWQSDMHAMANYLIVARIAGIPDEDAFKAFGSANRSAFLKEMITKIRADKK